MQLRRNHLACTLATTTLLMLGACGGGGGDSAPAPPAVTTTTFSGTAAIGKALANATITITCTAGAGSTTTSATGAYSAAIASVTLPCALKAAGTDGTVLYSVTTATPTGANTQVANITPLTQLLVASLTGTEPATFFSNFGATTAPVVTTANITSAQTAVMSLLTQAGVATTGLTDVIGGPLTAGSGTGYDGVLDSLQTQLASTGTPLATLTSTVASTAPIAVATGAVSADRTPRLPANLLLRDAASNCPSLRSGDYVSINPQRGVTLADQIASISVDAKTLKFTDNSHADGGGTVTTDGACAYKIGDDTFAVSKAGVLVGTSTEGDKKVLSLLVPRQSITVAELAGNWNGIGVDAGGDNPLDAFSVTVSSTGVLSDVVACNDGGATTAASCLPQAGSLSLTTDSAGNLSLSSTTPGDMWTDRIFAFRAGSGDLMVFELAPGGSLSVWTKKRTLTLSAVGQINPASRSFRINGDLVITNVDESLPGSVLSVDATAKTITRTQNLAGGITYTDTVSINSPRDGYNLRLPTTTQANNGSTINVRGRTSLGFPGMGLSFQNVPQVKSFQATVDR